MLFLKLLVHTTYTTLITSGTQFMSLCNVSQEQKEEQLTNLWTAIFAVKMPESEGPTAPCLLSIVQNTVAQAMRLSTYKSKHQLFMNSVQYFCPVSGKWLGRPLGCN